MGFVGEGGGRGGAGGAAGWRAGQTGGCGEGEGEGVRGDGGRLLREIVEVVREGGLDVGGVEGLLLGVVWGFGLGV